MIIFFQEKASCHYLNKGIISLELRPDVLGEGDEKEIIRRLKKARDFVIKYLGA